MAKHYYRTNVPLPIMIVWWVFCGICVLLYMGYDALVNGPKRDAQKQWDRDHFNGWRLEKVSYDTEHGLYYNKLDGGECTVRGYPGYPDCPPQLYYVDGKPQSEAPPNPTSEH